MSSRQLKIYAWCLGKKSDMQEVKQSRQREKKKGAKKEPAKQRLKEPRKSSIIHNKRQDSFKEEVFAVSDSLKISSHICIVAIVLAMRIFSRSFYLVLKTEVWFQWTEGIKELRDWKEFIDYSF